MTTHDHTQTFNVLIKHYTSADSCAIKAGRYLYTDSLLALEAIGSTSTRHQDQIAGFLPADTW